MSSPLERICSGCGLAHPFYCCRESTGAGLPVTYCEACFREVPAGAAFTACVPGMHVTAKVEGQTTWFVFIQSGSVVKRIQVTRQDDKLLASFLVAKAMQCRDDVISGLTAALGLSVHVAFGTEGGVPCFSRRAVLRAFARCVYTTEKSVPAVRDAADDRSNDAAEAPPLTTEESAVCAASSEPVSLPDYVTSHPLYWSALLQHFFAAGGTADRLLRDVDGGVEPLASESRSVADCLAGLLVAAAQLMLLSGQQPSTRAVVGNSDFFTSYMTDRELRDKEPLLGNAGVRQSITAYVNVCKQAISVFYNALKGNQNTFDEVFTAGGGRRAVNAEATAAPHTSDGVRGDPLVNYMVGLQTAKDHILHQRLSLDTEHDSNAVASKEGKRCELWVRAGFHLVLETINRSLFRIGAADLGAGEDAPQSPVTRPCAWLLMERVVHLLVAHPFLVSDKTTTLGDIVEEANREVAATAAADLRMSSLDLNWERNLAEDSQRSKRVRTLLLKRCEELLREHKVAFASVPAKEFPFRLSQLLFGWANSQEQEAGDTEIQLPCCQRHCEERGRKESTDFRSCTACLLRVLLPETPSDLAPLTQMSYGALEFLLKNQVRAVINILTDSAISVNRHIEKLYKIAAEETSVTAFTTKANAYLSQHTIIQSTQETIDIHMEKIKNVYATQQQVKMEVVQVQNQTARVYQMLYGGHTVKLSQVMAALQADPRDIRYVQAFASFSLLIDCDVEIPGLSVLLSAEKISVRGRRTINCSGTSGEAAGRNGASGADGTEESKDGGNGSLGECGSSGQDGGNITIYSRQPMSADSSAPSDGPASLTLRSSGGAGQPGGNGGRGGDGYSTRNGQDGSAHFVSFRGGNYEYHSVTPDFSEPPGKAGNGGGRGLGGLGGQGGDIAVDAANVEPGLHLDIPTMRENGANGADGRPGAAGNGGTGGRDGCAWDASYRKGWFGGKERYDSYSYFPRKTGPNAYDGRLAVRGRQGGSWGWTVYTSRSRTVWYNYTYRKWYCISQACYYPKNLKPGEFVSAGCLYHVSDFDGSMSTSHAQATSTEGTRVDFQQLQRQLGGRFADFCTDEAAKQLQQLQGAATAAAAAADAGLRAEVSHNLSLLDNLTSKNLDEIIIAVLRQSTFADALKELEEERVDARVRTQANLRGRSDRTGTDAGNEWLADVNENAVPLDVLEFHMVAPLYPLGDEITAFNIVALKTIAGKSSLRQYLRALSDLQRTIMNTMSVNVFALTCTANFYRQVELRIETILYRTSPEELLDILKPAREALGHQPASFERTAYQALCFRVAVSYCDQLAQSRPAALAPTYPPEVPVRASKLRSARQCAERLRYCAPHEIPQLYKLASLGVAPCPLFRLADLPDFAREWRMVAALGEAVYKNPFESLQADTTQVAFNAACKELIDQIDTAKRAERLDCLGHSILPAVYDWLCSFGKIAGTGFDAESLVNHVSITVSTLVLGARTLPQKHLALVILNNWKHARLAAEFVDLLLSAASAYEGNEEVNPWVCKSFGDTLGFALDHKLLSLKPEQCKALVSEWRENRGALLDPVVTILKLQFLHSYATNVLRTDSQGAGHVDPTADSMEKPLGDRVEGQTDCCCRQLRSLCETRTREEVESALKKLKEVDWTELAPRTPCWQCLQNTQALLSTVSESQFTKMDREQLGQKIMKGNSFALLSILEAKLPLIIASFRSGWAQVRVNPEAAGFLDWLDALYACFVNAPKKMPLFLDDRVWSDAELAPPSMEVLRTVQDATNWSHAPLYMPTAGQCSCFPLRKHAARLLEDALDGPFVLRARELLRKVLDAADSEAESNASLAPLAEYRCTDAALRGLCRLYLKHATKTVVEGHEMLTEALDNLTRYASLDVVLVVVTKIENAVDDHKSGRAKIQYPEYIRAALEPLEGIDMTDAVASALYGLDMCSWMTALQQRRLFQCVSLWWWRPGSGRAPLAQQLRHWLLSVGEDRFGDFLDVVRSLSADAVKKSLFRFLSVPAAWRSPVSKLNDVLQTGRIDSDVVNKYEAAWRTQRTRVVEQLRAGGIEGAKRQSSVWARDWNEIRRFIRDEDAKISAEVVNASERTQELLKKWMSSTSAEQEKRLQKFKKEYETNKKSADAPDGRKRVQQLDQEIRRNPVKMSEVVATILLSFFMRKNLVPRNVQVLAVLALLQGSVLANINTSEGKTYITGCVAAYKLYCGHRVAFATTSKDLGEEAMYYSQEALKALFGSAFSSVVEDAETATGSDDVYKHPLVYTTQGNLQGRCLRLMLDRRNEKRFYYWIEAPCWLVQDEADVAMVQDVTEPMYIGGQSLYARREILAFPALMKHAQDGDSAQDAYRTYWSRIYPWKAVKDEPVLSSSHFLRLWRSAQDVWNVESDREYVDVNGESTPYNVETGETMYCSSWKDGLSTMVSLKERQKWEWDTEPSITMDPLTFFTTRFKDRLTAVTGTAGGFATQVIYEREYGLTPIVVPPAFLSCFEELEPLLCATKAAYRTAIEAAIRDALGRNQDVLVAVKTVAEARELREYIDRRFKAIRPCTSDVALHQYAREKLDKPPTLDELRLSVFFVTYLGGRGLDVKPVAARCTSGIHVILCGPQHERCSHQVLRRAARQYYPGSGQIIGHSENADDQTSAASISSGKSLEDFYEHQNGIMDAERWRLQTLVVRDIAVSRFRQSLQEEVRTELEKFTQGGKSSHAAAQILQHRFALWMQEKETTLSQSAHLYATQVELLKDFRETLLSTFQRLADGSAPNLSVHCKTAEERILAANALKPDPVKPFCDAAVFELYRREPVKSCLFGVRDLVGAIDMSSQSLTESNVDATRKHLRYFIDTMNTWITALEQFMSDQETLGEADSEANEARQDYGDSRFVRGQVKYLTLIRDHYTPMVGTDGKLLFSLFQSLDMTFSDTVSVVSTLVDKGFVHVNTIDGWSQQKWKDTRTAMMKVFPVLQDRPMQGVTNVLGALRFCCSNGVSLDQVDALFAGEHPILPPITIASDLFHQHNETYAETLSKAGVLSSVTGVLLHCAGTLRREQVKQLRVEDVREKYRDQVENDIVQTFSLFGYQQLIHNEEHEHCEKVRKALERERKKKEEENSWWGKLKKWGSTALSFVLDHGVNWVLNAVCPGAGFIFKHVVVPFIKAGVQMARDYYQTGQLKVKKFFTSGIAGSVIGAAGRGLKKAGAWVASKLNQIPLVSELKDLGIKAVENTAAVIHSLKKYVVSTAEACGLKNAVSRFIARKGAKYTLNVVKRRAVKKFTSALVGKPSEDAKQLMQKRLREPLLRIMQAVKQSKSATEYATFLKTFSRDVQTSKSGADLVEVISFTADSYSSLSQTFETTLLASSQFAHDEVAATIETFAATCEGLRSVISGPREVIKRVCDEYVGVARRVAAEQCGIASFPAASAADAEPADPQQELVLNMVSQLVDQRLVRPLTTLAHNALNSLETSISTAMNKISEREAREEAAARAMMKDILLGQHDYSTDGFLGFCDRTRFVLQGSLAAPRKFAFGISLPQHLHPFDIAKLQSGQLTIGFMMSWYVSTLPQPNWFDKLMEKGEKVTEFLTSTKGKVVVGAALAAAIDDPALATQVMLMLSGECIVVPVVVTEAPTTAEVVVMIVMLLYQRFYMHRRLEYTTFSESLVQVCVHLFRAIFSSSSAFESACDECRDRGRAPPSLKPLFAVATKYANRAYYDDQWVGAKMVVRGSSVAKPTYQVYVDDKEKLIVLTFRGTTSFVDVLTDVAAVPATFCGTVCHRGFAANAISFFEDNNGEGPDKVRELAAQHPSYRILVTGHSLGGATAILAGLRMKRTKFLQPGQENRLIVVGVAAPPCTSYYFEASEEVYNLINYLDVVPRFQINSLDRLLRLLFDDDTVLENPSLELLQPANTFFKEDKVNGVLSASDSVWRDIHVTKELVRVFKDHLSSNYVQFVERM